MLSATGFLRQVAVTLALVPAALAFKSASAIADDGFPFGFEMTLDAAPQPGSKRVPTLEIGDNGEATLDLWCKSGKGQFSVAGNTVIFVARSAAGSRLPAGAGAGRRRTGRGLDRGRDLEAAGRSGVVHRNQAAALPDQYQLKSPDRRV